MQKNNLKNTQKKLGLLFAMIIFFLSFFLVFLVLSFKFLNIQKQESIVFYDFLNHFESQKQNEIFLNNFLNRSFEQRQQRLPQRGLQNKDRGVMTLDFVITNYQNEIIYENIKKDININKILELNKIVEKNIFKKSGISFYKTSISNNNSIIFVYFYSYSINDYLKDLSFFGVFLIIFSFLFYFLGYFFSKKILKPIEKNMQDMTDFIHNASHELKTPLSVISLNMQLLNELKTYDKNLVLNSINEVKKIDSLILGLLSLSSITDIKNKEDIFLDEEINSILKENELIFKDKNIKTTFTKQNPQKIKANKEYIIILLSNLIKNAYKYNTQNGTINIILENKTLKITNSGPEIQKKDIQKIFDRFYKTDTSRNTEGFGIGLSLVKKICDIYDFKISVASQNSFNAFEIIF